MRRAHGDFRHSATETFTTTYPPEGSPGCFCQEYGAINRIVHDSGSLRRSISAEHGSSAEREEIQRYKSRSNWS